MFLSGHHQTVVSKEYTNNVRNHKSLNALLNQHPSQIMLLGSWTSIPSPAKDKGPKGTTQTTLIIFHACWHFFGLLGVLALLMFSRGLQNKEFVATMPQLVKTWTCQGLWSKNTNLMFPPKNPYQGGSNSPQPAGVTTKPGDTLPPFAGTIFSLVLQRRVVPSNPSKHVPANSTLFPKPGK